MSNPYMLRADATDDDLDYVIHHARDIWVEGGYDFDFSIWCSRCRDYVIEDHKWSMRFFEVQDLVERHMNGDS